MPIQVNNPGLVNYPDFNYAGGFPQNVVGRVTAEQAAAMAGLDVKQALDWCQYDTRYAKGGAALPSSPFQFFQTQQGQLEQLINDTTVSFSKSSMDTNMVQGGQLERGQLLVVESIQACVNVLGNFDLTLQSTGNTTLPATLPGDNVSTTATAGNIAANLIRAALRGITATLKVGNNTFESGPLMQFPAEFGVSGPSSQSFTGTAQTGVIVAEDTLLNNGFGSPRFLRFPRIIEAGQNFSVICIANNPFTPNRAFDIQFILRGLLFRDVS